MLFFRGKRSYHPLPPKIIVDGLLQYQSELDRQYTKVLRAQGRMLECVAELDRLLGSRQPEQQPTALPASREGIGRYLAGSWFLYDCHSYLMQREPEWLHYVTGLHFDRVRTLDRMVTFKLEKQSPGYVKGDEMATRDALCDMEEHGHALQGVFHSHRMKGSGAVNPSMIDRAHQERLERGHYPVISGIFSEDGYIRFFALERTFQIQTYGKGVEQIEEHLFKLTEVP